MCRILNRFLDFCQPYQLTGPWRELAAAECFSAPADGAAVLPQLLAEYGEAAMIEAGVAQRRPDGLILNPALVGAENGVIALRSAADEPPFALLTSAGAIPDESAPSLAVLRDRGAQDLLERCGSALLVGFRVADVIILRSLGLPATTADSWFGQSVADWARLESIGGWAADVAAVNATLPSFADGGPLHPATEATFAEPAADDVSGESQEPSVSRPSAVASARPGSAAESAESELPPSSAPIASSAAMTAESPQPDATRPLTLVLVGWSPARLSLDQPPEFRRLIERLLQAAQYLDFDVSRIAVWLPTPDDLRRLRFCLDAQDLSAAHRAVTDSVDSSLFTIAEVLRASSDSSRATGGYLRALQRHEQAVQNRFTGGDAARAQETERLIHDAIDRDLVEPIIEKAQAEDDPLNCNLGMAAAYLARELHRLAVPAAPLPVGAAAAGNEWTRTRERISLLCKLATNFRAYAQELRR